MADVYMPPRPVLPGGRPCEPPPPCPAPDIYAPVCPPPPGPPPCGKNPDIPQLRPVPPVPSPIEGSSLYESMCKLTERVNLCINQWNQIQRNAYESLNQAVQIARANDVYYDDCEVHYTEGYDTTEGAAYAIVEKKVVDKAGRPIYVNLVPAYRNSSNPGVNQPIFDASFIESANVIITAVQAGSKTWGGPAMWNGAPMPGDAPVEGQVGYVYGFTRHGALRYFENTVSETTLVQNGMYNVIGGCIPILYDGKLLDGVDALTDREAVTAIGYNAGTGSVFFFSCSDQNEPGMGIASVARILQGYGCTVAVVTSATVNAITVTDTEGMLYMGQMTTDPNQAREPANLAYWVISKRPCFKNAFQKEVADLIQTTGQNAWKNYLLGVQIQEFDDRILENSKAIQSEVERATAAEQQLQNNIDAEQNRAEAAEAALDAKIEAETTRAEAAENALDQKIEAETERAKAAELQLQINITAEETRAKNAESQIRQDLNTEVLRAINREKEIQDALDAEIASRISADNDIINSIEQEILARRAADTELRTYIEQEIAKVGGNIGTINNQISGIMDGSIALPYLKLTGGTLTGAVNFSANNTLTLGRGPVQPMEAATKQYVDDAIAGGTTPGGDVSKEYVDQQISTLANQLDGKLDKAGGTMSGTLNMDNHYVQNPILVGTAAIKVQMGDGGLGKLTNLAAPTDPTDAVPKAYVDTEISSAIEAAKAEIEGDASGKYLPLAGGDMTGDINMTGASTIKFYDTASRATAKLAKSTKIARVAPGQQPMGSVYNDDTTIVVKSEAGAVALKGYEINVSDSAGGQVPIEGASRVQLLPGQPTSSSLILDPTYIKVQSPTLAVGPATGDTGQIRAGGLNLSNGDGTAGSSIVQHNGHLDINVNDATGSVYLNRTATSGGTGDLHVTEIHAPNELRLNPGSSINAMNHRIANVSNPINPMDAINKQFADASYVLASQAGSKFPTNTLTITGSNSMTFTDATGRTLSYVFTMPGNPADYFANINILNAFLYGDDICVLMKATANIANYIQPAILRVTITCNYTPTAYHSPSMAGWIYATRTDGGTVINTSGSFGNATITGNTVSRAFNQPSGSQSYRDYKIALFISNLGIGYMPNINELIP